ncbi:MAG: (Fe-S)-binding protein [Pseudomonadota bacterium]
MSKPISAGDLPCIQCAKCTHVCPQNMIDPTFTPRGFLLKALMGEGQELEAGPEVWQCLTCLKCRDACPSSTDWVGLVKELRQQAKEQDQCFECKHGRLIQILQRMMTSPSLKQDRLGWAEGLQYADKGEVFYFTGCLPYFDDMFTYSSHTSIAQATLKLLNAGGVVPVLSNEERCCGYECLWNGDKETFLKLARLNVEAIAATGAKTVVTSCAECFRTLKADYADEIELPFEVVHSVTLIADWAREGKLRFKAPDGPGLTYHDPCRLGRYEGVYDAPREILKAIAGERFTEMERVRADALCCGVGNFSNCDANTKFLQHDRLLEAKRTGAEVMVTTCPKCRIHYGCYLDGRPIEPIEDLVVKDITEIAAEALET